MRNFSRKLQYYQKMEDIDTHAHHDGNEELVQDVKAEGEAEDLDDEDDVPIKRCRLEKKSFNCKVCQKKFSKPETARMHVEVVHMKLYQVSISSTFYVRIFSTNFVSVAFFLVTCTWKKLPKRRSYEKRARIKLMRLTAGNLGVP